MENGWIKLHRQIQSCDIWTGDEPFDRRSAWIDLLLMANHTDKMTIFEGKAVQVQRGQILTSVRKLAERWHWGKDRVLHYLHLLEALSMVDRDADTHRTLLTIVNYSKFQSMENGETDTVTDTVEDTKQTRSRHGQATNNNELKNVKNVKNITPIVPFSDNEKVNEAIKAFREHRKTIKSPMTDNAVQIFAKRLRRLSTDPDEQVLMIETAIEHGWKTVYPLKEEDKPKPADDGMGEMERRYYANQSRYDGPDFFARRNNLDSLGRESG